MTKDLEELIENLTEEERDVIENRFGIRLDCVEAAKAVLDSFEETRRRIDETEQRALAKLGNRPPPNSA